MGTNPIVKRPCQVDHTSRFGPQQILWIFGYAMLLEDADPAVDRGRPVMGVTKRALTPWCLVLRCSKSRAEEISTWALPLPVYVLYICIPHAGAPPQTVLWQLALMAWGADGWLPFYSVRGNLWIPVMATAGFTLWQLLPRIWCICCSSQSWRANDRHSCLSLLALVGWRWVNAMLRMALLASLVAEFVIG